MDAPMRAGEERDPMTVFPTQQDVMRWVETKRLSTTVDARLKKLGEEVGEVFGAVVALDEGRLGKFNIAQELAQTTICLLGLAEALGIDLDIAVRTEWTQMQTRTWEHLDV